MHLPSLNHQLVNGSGAAGHAGAHSFMPDTELSHCEQFCFGSMLTNELSSASSQTYPGVAFTAGNLSFLRLILQERERERQRIVSFCKNEADFVYIYDTNLEDWSR